MPDTQNGGVNKIRQSHVVLGVTWYNEEPGPLEGEAWNRG